MKLFGHKLSGYSQTLVILVAVFLVSTGLCGITAKFGEHLGEPWIVVGLIDLLVMTASFLGVLIMLAILPFRLWTQAKERRRQAESEDYEVEHAEQSMDPPVKDEQP